MKFVNHDQPMVEPDFQLDTIHPNDEPFWTVASPYATDHEVPFLIDRAGAMELIRQLQLGLARYIEAAARKTRSAFRTPERDHVASAMCRELDAVELERILEFQKRTWRHGERRRGR